jgi:hypothetical protein
MRLKTKQLAFSCAGIAFLLLSACTTLTPVMRTGDGEYIVTRSGDTGFTSVGKLRRKAVEDVNQYAAQRGLIPEIISVNEVPAGFGIFPQVDIRFRLVKQERNVSSGQPKGTTINSSYDSRGHRTFENTAR